MKSLRSTIVLLIIAAAIGGYIYFNERGPVVQQGNVALLRVDPESVDTIHLAAAPGKDLTLHRNGDSWQVAQGKAPAVPGDPDAVKTLLDQLQLVQASEKLPTDAAKLKEYGLDKPHGSLTVNATTIQFGTKPGFDTNHIYALFKDASGTTAALVPAALSDAATKSFDDWRDKALLRIDADKATQVQLQAPAITATFVKEKSAKENETASWSVTQPLRANADAGVVTSFLTALPQTKTTKFLEDSPKSTAKWGLDKPVAVVKVTVDGATRELRVGKKVGSDYAAQNSLSPAVFELPSSTYGLLNRPLRDWRDKDVLKIALDDISQVEITARGATRSFTKSGDKWQAAGNTSGNAEAQHQAVLDALLAVQNLRADDFVAKPGPPAAYGLDQPMVQVKLTSSAWSGPKTLRLAAKNHHTYAEVSGAELTTPLLSVLPASALDGFKTSLDVLFPTAPKAKPGATPVANKTKK
jgi:hypothetical protein